MTETSNKPPIIIYDRRDNRVIHESKTAKDMRSCVEEAHAAKVSLVGARLDYASLVGASLVGARLDYASLDGARLDGARLDYASLDYASLVGARLDYASLDGASLVGARLDGASLVGARLDGEAIVSVASVSFTGHGACGRTLTGIKTKSKTTMMCGCFYGSTDELVEYIKNNEKKYAKSRTLAMKTVLVLLKQKRDES